MAAFILIIACIGCRPVDDVKGNAAPLSAQPCSEWIPDVESTDSGYPCARDDWECIAYRIIDGVISLKQRFPRLCGLDRSCMGESGETFSASLWFDNGVTYVPNPNYKPHKKSMRELPVYDSVDGVRVNLYIFLGPWRGALRVGHLPRIGELSILNLTQCPNPDVIDAIVEIIDRERRLYEEEYYGAVSNAAAWPAGGF